jgi:ADP-heptose:LPS heptosyltransferase
MNIAVVRKIDLWLGIPLCWILTVIERMISLFRDPATFTMPPKNIMFLELSEMGSAIIAYSAMQKTRALFPDTNLFFLIFEENKESVYFTKVIPPAQVLTIRSKGGAFGFLRDIFSVLGKMRRLRIDTAIDLELFSRVTSLLSYLSGAQRRVGFHKFRMEGLSRGDLLTHKVQYNVYQHMALNFLNLVYALNAPLAEVPKLKQHLTDTPTVPRVESSETEKARMFAELQHIQPKLKTSDTLIVFNPNAGLLPIRAWPLPKYVELAQRLTQHASVYIVVMGVNEASKDAAVIATAIGERCIDLTNKTTLREVIDLFNLAAVLVANDSGPAHFAALTPIKNFVFFGPETPNLYAPLGTQTFPIFANYSCSPCLSAFNHRNTPCTDPQCIKHIPVDEVYAKIVQQLYPPSGE